MMRAVSLILTLVITSAVLAQTEVAVLKLPGMEKVDVRKDLRYEGDLYFDLYRPPNAKTPLPLVVFINGVGSRELPDWGQYTSWPRLVAARGMAAIVYETNATDADTIAAQTAAFFKYVRAHASELKIDASRIALWACSANVRLATKLVAEEDFRAAALYYGIMANAPKSVDLPVLVTRAGLDSAMINDSIDRWVAQAVALDMPLTFINYPQGVHAFDLRNDTDESRAIISQTLDFLEFHLTHTRAPREPMTLAQLSKLISEQGVDAAVSRLRELRQTHPSAGVLREQSLNSLGYALLGEKKPADAVKVLTLVATLFPESANAHDSLADAYEAAGMKPEALFESERALQLLPKALADDRDAIRRSAEGRLKRLRQ